MDEVTHEIWAAGHRHHGYSEKTAKVHIGHHLWSSGRYSIKELENMGWEVRPIHIDLENK